jgi:prenyltransferase beta subunit
MGRSGGGTRTATLTIAVCAAATLAAVCPAQAATARDSKFQPNLEATVRYLQDAQREDGGFAEPGSEPNPDFSAWVTLALAAAGINPRDQTTVKQHYAGGDSAYTYLAEHAHEAYQTTDFERELLVVDAAGTSPHDFGGVDLTGEILKRQIATGSSTGAFPHEAGSRTAGINDTIFAILSLSPIHEQVVEAAIGRATQWLEAEQDCDGSWHSVYPRPVRPCGPARRLLPGEETGEVDMTGAALEALNAAKRPDREGQARAFEYLHEAEAPSGGFSEFHGEREPNVASTAWVVQAMWSAGINPETWTTRSGLASEEPLGYLASMQQEDGHIRWKQSQELNGMWMTAYVAPAFTGNPQPIPEAPDEQLPALPPEGPTGASIGPSQGTGTGGGDGGVSTNPGGGVIAGGGGSGAPLFSRPRPASKGHTPGGARQLTVQKQHDRPQKHDQPRRHDHPRGHRRNPGRNPGPARGRTAPTITSTDVAKTGFAHRNSTTVAQASGSRKGRGAGTASRDLGASSRAKRHNRSSGAANWDQGPGAGPAATGTGGRLGNDGAPLPAAAPGQSTRTTAGAEVKGVLIGSPAATDVGDRLESGAPGLRSAGAGGDQEQWLTIATYGAIVLLILAGALIEHKRPRTTL